MFRGTRWLRILSEGTDIAEVGRIVAMIPLETALNRVRAVIDHPGRSFYRCVDLWKVERDGERSGSSDSLVRRLVANHSAGGYGDESASWLFLGYLVLKVVERAPGHDSLDDLACWRVAYRLHAADLRDDGYRPAVEYAPDHLVWWKLRRASQTAWTWLALVALEQVKKGRDNRDHLAEADVMESQELASELVAWVLDVDRRERETEEQAGEEVGALAGRLVYLPQRAPFAAWMHQIGLQQVRRALARQRGVSPGAVALDVQGGMSGRDDSSALSMVPEALVVEGENEGVLFGEMGSDWQACRGAVLDGYVTDRELDAMRLAAAVHWERAGEVGISPEAFSWALFGPEASGDPGKRLQGVAARLFLWLRLGEEGTDRIERELARALEAGWVSGQQIEDTSVGLRYYLRDRDVRFTHLERGGATWGVPGRLQFAVFNLCAALTLGTPTVERAVREFGRDPMLAAWLSRRNKLGLETSPLLKGESTVAVFGPRGPDLAVARRSVWDILDTMRAIVRLAELMKRARGAQQSAVLGEAAERLRVLDPDRPDDIASLRHMLRQAHRAAPEGLPRMAASYWLYDPNSAERDRLRSLVSAARANEYPVIELAEACERPVRSTGWGELDGRPLLELLRTVEEAR